MQMLMLLINRCLYIMVYHKITVENKISWNKQVI